MLPNHPQRTHRRQNSTPSAFHGVKKPSVPAARQSRAAAHRRGLSLDTRRMGQANPTALEGLMVSITTNNSGLGNPSQHDLLREAQQQRTLARPGQEQQRHHQELQLQQQHRHQAYFSPESSSDIDNYLTPHGTPQTQSFDSPAFDPTHSSLSNFANQISLSASPFDSVIPENTDFDLFVHESAHSTPNFPSFYGSPASQGYISEDDTTSTRKALRRRVSNGIRDRVDKFEAYDLDSQKPTGQRPMTPPEQNALINFPPTPMETPQHSIFKQESRSTSLDSTAFDDWMNETIKPQKNTRNMDNQDVFQQMREQAEAEQAMASSPGPSPNGYGGLPLDMATYGMDMLDMDMMGHNPFESGLLDGFGSSQPSPSGQFSLPVPDGLSFNPGSMFAPLPHNGFPLRPTQNQSGNVTQAQLEAVAQPQHGFIRQSSAGPSRAHGHSRSDSTATSMTASTGGESPVNDWEPDMEAAKTETGITEEAINQYISGPSPDTGKWTCTFTDCSRVFGRKENIRAHVQTHLDDRKYLCQPCGKRFVRQHDLRRHAKIHSGKREFKCPCDRAFARHDALTRHRQRGMCRGAFDDVVRTPKRRGRPPKPTTRLGSATPSTGSSNQTGSPQTSPAPEMTADPTDPGAWPLEWQRM